MAKRVFSAAVQGDTLGLKSLVANSATYVRARVLAGRFPALFAAARRDVVIQDVPLLVTQDSAYIVYLPEGYRRSSDLLALRFDRRGDEWLVSYIGFQEPGR
ncbi:MAG TPA: hypothetical protein VF092_02395 [Longimicrobium sp.]